MYEPVVLYALDLCVSSDLGWTHAEYVCQRMSRSSDFKSLRIAVKYIVRAV